MVGAALAYLPLHPTLKAFFMYHALCVEYFLYTYQLNY